jgi:hypothetical protein
LCEWCVWFGLKSDEGAKSSSRASCRISDYCDRPSKPLTRSIGFHPTALSLSHTRTTLYIHSSSGSRSRSRSRRRSRGV